MTMLWSEWELDEEGWGGKSTKPLPRPSLLLGLDKEKPTVQEHGHAEIKPHHRRGFEKARNQLKKSSPGSKLLITYRPEDARHRFSMTPAKVHLFLTEFEDLSPNQLLAPTRKWWDLGAINPPPSVPVNLADNAAIFGYVVEDMARNRFHEKLLAPRGWGLDRKPSGGRGNPDVVWELAEFYRELGRQLGDPFYTELGASLH